MNKKQKIIIAVSILVYLFVIVFHIIDSNDPSTPNYKGGQPAKSKGSN